MVLCKRLGNVVGRVVLPAVLASVTMVATLDGAEARRKNRGGYAPPFASIVVDAKTGKILQATNPDAARHPASITKVMTLYMLFEQLERGRLSLESEIRMSSYCAGMSPSKIGLRAGETIGVEDAIKAVVTKSANDVACAIGEAIAGNENAFGNVMTQRARSIGMRSTNFENASGLPNPRQITTARDLATLGKAIQERFPRYYPYFGTRVFSYDGYAYRNHNKLLGRVEGVDGIKTGYVRASGFNLLTSAKSDGRHIVAVVLGGRSGRIRDAQMAGLVDSHLPRAFAGRVAPRPVEVASNDDDDNDVIVRPKAPQAVAFAALPPPRPRAIAVEAQPQRAAQVQVAAPNPRIGQPMALLPRGVAQVRPGSAPLTLAATGAPRSLAPPTGGKQQQARLVPPGNVTYTNGIDAKAAEAELDQPLPVYNGFGASMKQAQIDKAANQKAAKADGKTRTGWVIQLAATDDEGKARGILAKAKSQSPKMLASADAFTEKVQKGDATLYRARFGGFEDGEAQAACTALKRSGFACIAQRI